MRAKLGLDWQDGAVHKVKTDRAKRFRRWFALPLLAILVVLSAGGCVRVRAALAVAGDDHVSGDVIISSLAIKTGDTGPAITIPPELSKKIKVEKYSADNYVGQRLTFEKLSFVEFEKLAKTITTGSYFQLGFRRSGDLVTLSGSADLNSLPADRADVQLKIAFPGAITRTNGIANENEISWKPTPGTASGFDATAEYTSGASGSLMKWVLILGGATAVVALLVLVLAVAAHRRHVRKLKREAAVL
ncbi:uncharacterized protein DUF3153 [Herbihabitans rhizosphaerae]|uniref:Uncharacterized protein DUF3153 n=1 Tax=Herbihabitans rhizosphaerae TaxID=1872711 RepID=A0A4Q7KQ68_9PSEU|nr:DUF3153 domain-containing protein [Herbihabitans rhizosphaerae]RZS38958.1 uncharacterized protein DUF3153 [Herbihabitans rhizosphaerae]